MRIAVTLYVMLVIAIGSSIAYGRTLQFTGPYTAVVLRVIDGDTLVARIAIWPRTSTTLAVRLAGVDTPESSRRFAKCEQERLHGLRAKEFVKKLLPPGTELRLFDPKLGKYAGRVVAAVKYRQFMVFEDLAQILRLKGFARDYEGGKKSNWCAK